MRTSAIYLLGLSCLILVACTSVNAQRYYRDTRYSYGHSSGYYRSVPRASFYSQPYRVIPYHGSSYYYANGSFYRPYGSYFSVIAPPLGIHINLLPYGYRRVYAGSTPYYYYEGTFYYPHDNYYEVVNAPVGAEVPELPRDSRVVVIDNQKYYESNGTYFKESIHDNGEIWYTVTGKHGVLKTDQYPPAPVERYPSSPNDNYRDDNADKDTRDNPDHYYQSTPPQGDYPPVQNEQSTPPLQTAPPSQSVPQNGPVTQSNPASQGTPPPTAPVNPVPQERTKVTRDNSSSPEVGSSVSQLPQDSKVVIINNQKLYVAPDGTYYSEVIKNNQMHYKVVGK
jgi:Family of unknown function (DUF6515)